MIAAKLDFRIPKGSCAALTSVAPRVRRHVAARYQPGDARSGDRPQLRVTEADLLDGIRAEVLGAAASTSQCALDEGAARDAARQQLDVLTALPPGTADALPPDTLRALLASQGRLAYECELRRRAAVATAAGAAAERAAARRRGSRAMHAARLGVSACDELLAGCHEQLEQRVVEPLARGAPAAERGEDDEALEYAECIQGLLEVRRALLEHAGGVQQLLTEDESEQADEETGG
ncbi:hypothetical protein MNEG_2121 [Monoraphidium neglectum]|uniref:Uncharacterized protein n=1 Tax=Monoraphidium neglectum TaxID=145388 RepID=A0A0D2LH65_9CHLO|nr:hypothetical protein MNEG_2121 [Monoraphidium neglectum]KIZ05844.1 hypothetical protein MNEG_2121 [Monoraphidium neglectum]|eukprot:XP_013904863.1 hypothetical protein MNEG_2121 [Monoraphidium neglectum]